MTVKPYHGKGWRISGTDAHGEPLTMLFLGVPRRYAMHEFIKRMAHKQND